jgi:hypothetical protein
VETLDQLQPLQAQIEFSSTEFSTSSNGIWADFTATTQSDSTGQFQATLPAGKYQVLVVPPGDGKHAVLDTQWTIQSVPSSQAGRLLQVPPYAQIKGSVDGYPQDSTLQAATIEATPTNSLLYDAPTQIVALRNGSTGARTASAIFQPQSNPSFSLLVDTGLFDISLRPPDSLPWLISPSNQIVTGTNVLPGWTMPLPVPWTGTMRTSSNTAGSNPNASELPWAVVRIYALLGDNLAVVSQPNLATKIVQIAQTRALADGSFQLELPDQIQP